MSNDLIARLKTATKGSSKVSIGSRLESSQKLRSSSRRNSESKTARFQLVQYDGIFEWEETSGGRPNLKRYRRSGGSETTSDQDAVAELEFEKLAPSQITSFLEERDQELTPNRGIRRINVKRMSTSSATLPKSGNVLLLVHGTFSNTENLLSNFSGSESGMKFLNRAARKYKNNIFAFDHPTLSVSPILNAMDIARSLNGSSVKVDFIAHSRGGLVCKWLKEMIDPNGINCRKMILAGSPLAGTGLAAPPNIRKTINLLTGIGNAVGGAVGLASLAVPILSVVEALLKVLTSITRFAAKTPIADAAIAMVPGLFSMSRVGNNPELKRLLMSGVTNPTDYYAIQSNFEPTDPAWKFWRMFRKERLANFATDVIFDGDNDLVVDTSSMGQLAGSSRVAKSRTLDFGVSETVHHLNYFQQPKTHEFLSKILL